MMSLLLYNMKPQKQTHTPLMTEKGNDVLNYVENLNSRELCIIKLREHPTMINIDELVV